ncbi:acyl carrier protein [Massilia sp. MB5]|uniref:acyl carrier protein n=1 Tax=unclassified Massilia TaxID=2609279 RepID=UPI00067D68C9|nr:MULTISPECIES: acyl carrier protein [unclassified Massilia]AKU21010.1 hypothetical protein ACZ75_05410 [Massilia sp. NR 4-1]UMR29437.1 acyl carrier protein [Massilia sp. MB5]
MPHNPGQIFELLVQHTREVIPELEAHEFIPADSLKALGANSMDRADIIMMTMSAISLRCALIDLARAGNMGELAALMHEKLAHA